MGNVVGSGDYTYVSDTLGSVLRRIIWDGAQELIEIQVPGGRNEAQATLEDDDSPVVVPRVNNGDPNPLYGRVLYVHGIEIDRPVATVRYNYVDNNYRQTAATHFPVSAARVTKV